MKKISAIIVTLVIVLIAFAIIGSMVFVYPIVAGQKLTLPSEHWVQYKQGWKLTSFHYVPYGAISSIPYDQLYVEADNYPLNNGFPVGLYPITRGATYNVDGTMRITISEINLNYLVISISSSSKTSLWQTTSIIYIIVIAILLAVIIALLLLRKRKTVNLNQ
jgi:hypothetical protein